MLDTTTATTLTGNGNERGTSPAVEGDAVDCTKSPIDWQLDQVAQHAEDAIKDFDSITTTYNTAYPYAFGALQSGVMMALQEIARDEPDIDRVRWYLSTAYASAAAVRGKYTEAMDFLRRHEAIAKQVATGHYPTLGTFTQGRYYRNRCACGEMFYRADWPDEDAAEAHAREFLP